MNDLANIPGLYGKIPVLGDFVSRRLTTRFVDIWDAWLNSALSASREQLGARWLDIYLTSPIWHFILSPGICSSTAWTGILLPSVDRVGRYFPLTFAVPLDAFHWLPGIFYKADKWYEQLEQVAISALEDDLDLDELDCQLQAQPLSGEFITASNAADRFDYSREDGRLAFHGTLDSLDQLNEAFAQLGFDLLADTQPTYSLWCTKGSELMKPCLRVYHHLPPADAFSDLMVGQNAPQADRCEPKNKPDNPYGPTNQGYRHINSTVDHLRFQWCSSAATTVGKRRKINEDAYLERPEIGLWVVADGMGGHSAGDVASRRVIDALGTLMASGNLDSYAAYATECLRTVNADLLRMAADLGKGQIMGTTVVVMLAVGDRCAAIWAGDSRLYQCRRGVLTQLTRDHSLAGELYRQGVLDGDSQGEAGMENIVTRALGAGPELELDVVNFEAVADDIYLLCSDGLVKEVQHFEINNILEKGDCRTTAQALIDLALERGARDNVTVVVARAGRDSPDTSKTGPLLD